VFGRRYISDNSLHFDTEIIGQRRQEPVQILSADFASDRYKNVSDVLRIVEDVLIMEAIGRVALPLLQHFIEDDNEY